MASVPKSAGRIGGRRLTIAVLLVVWLGVIVVGAGATADGSTWIGVPSFDWLNYVFAMLVILGAVVIVASLIAMPKGDGSGPRKKRKPIWPFLIVAGLFLMLVRRPEQTEGVAITPEPIEPVEPAPFDAPGGASGVGGQELLVLAIMLALAIAIVVWSRRGLIAGIGDDDDDESLERALGPAVERAAEQLLTGTDPRSAVLMAYRSLESALERHGLSRHRSETPAEYLVRVLADLPLDTDPLITLSNLYEEARFSTHPITAGDQRTAASALDSIRQQLASTSRTSSDQGTRPE